MRTPLAATMLSALLVGCAPGPNLGDDDATMTSPTADDGGSGLDESRIDRTEDEGPCGFPAGGYGTEVGDKIANNATSLVMCDGTAIELADSFCKREDEYGDYNRGVLINIGAGWCGPCQEETLEFPELYEEYHEQGIEFVQILFQDWDSQTPTKTFCEEWRTGQWVGEGGETIDVSLNLQFPVAIDQVFNWTSTYLTDPASATPVNMLVDANGNIRWKSLGIRPDPADLKTQFDLVIANPYGD